MTETASSETDSLLLRDVFDATVVYATRRLYTPDEWARYLTANVRDVFVDLSQDGKLVEGVLIAVQNRPDTVYIKHVVGNARTLIRFIERLRVPGVRLLEYKRRGQTKLVELSRLETLLNKFYGRRA